MWKCHIKFWDDRKVQNSFKRFLNWNVWRGNRERLKISLLKESIVYRMPCYFISEQRLFLNSVSEHIITVKLNSRLKIFHSSFGGKCHWIELILQRTSPKAIFSPSQWIMNYSIQCILTLPERGTFPICSVSKDSVFLGGLTIAWIIWFVLVSD